MPTSLQAAHRPSDGYLRISLKPYRHVPKRIYYGHRLACLYMNGHFPLDEMDYIDGDVYNLKWSNLRPATRSQQRMNTKLLKDRNVSGADRGISGIILMGNGQLI